MIWKHGGGNLLPARKSWNGSFKQGIRKLQEHSRKGIIIIQFIYLSAWQQPDKANYSQALKQEYRMKYNILISTSALQMKK
jgi:hypothetical protein